MDLEGLRTDCMLSQKKRIHFIIASVFIWGAILCIQLTSFSVSFKNLLTFCSSALLLPIAYFISRILKIDFQNKSNPLTELGLLFTFNQMLYLLIAMWAYNAVPEKMLMILAIIFGAHLMPYSWLYRSRAYLVFSVMIPFLSLGLGISGEPYLLALVMMLTEAVFSLLLFMELSKYRKYN